MIRPEIEICAYSIESCISAARAGATRVELCASPYEGGTTPSAAAIQITKEIPNLELSVMVRPRGGDFLYSNVEFEQMKREIEFIKTCGADGIVIGLLMPNGKVDIKRTSMLVSAAYPMEVTFHRAFDMSCNWSEALEYVISSGCRRLLTSGCRNTATEGIDNIREIVSQSAGRIEIMAGSGVNMSNVFAIAETGVDAIHLSAKQLIDSNMTYRNNKVTMGGIAGIPEYETACADENIIRQIVKLFDQ